jgi:hypothetical protein
LEKIFLKNEKETEKQVPTYELLHFSIDEIIKLI